MENKTSVTRFIIGIIFVLLGAIVLSENLGWTDLNWAHYIFAFPSILIFVGIISLLSSSKKGFGLVLISIGSIWWVTKSIQGINFGEVFFPIVLISIGLYILFFRNRNSSAKINLLFNRKEEINMDKIDVIAIFGGGDKTVKSNNFQGGSITTIFGGADIDLIHCKLAEGENKLDVVAIFGGFEMQVPKEWNVVSEVFPIFGGFASKNKKYYGVTTEANRTLIIKGFVMFGGGEVKYY